MDCLNDESLSTKLLTTSIIDGSADISLVALYVSAGVVENSFFVQSS